MAVAENMSRRSVFKGLPLAAVAAPLPALSQNRDNPQDDTYLLLGMWVALSPQQKFIAGKQLRAKGLTEIADALRSIWRLSLQWRLLPQKSAHFVHG